VLVEEVPEADAYRLAAAELLTTYFSKHYVINPKVRLAIYIFGSQGGKRTVSYHVPMGYSTIVYTRIGIDRVPVYGSFSISDAAGFMTNYSDIEKTQLVTGQC
jgi:hypothetical protein